MVRHVSGNSYPKNLMPANSSRFFNSKEEAVLQPLGKMQLEIRELGECTNRNQGHYITNTNYDQSLIRFDSLYCTDSPFLLEHSFKVIMGVIGKLNRQDLHIFDIGCGQGELVMRLRNHGFNAFGYDPVLREPSAFLYATIFGENEIIRGNGNNLYILRCVLPHLENPMEFVDGIFDKDPEAMIYIEWQSPNYIINSNAFYMVMHDHVNYFSFSTFLNYQTESYGQFGEWEYVLIRSTQRRLAKLFGERAQDLDKKLERGGEELLNGLTKTFNLRWEYLEALNCKKEIDEDSRFIIYSAAGKAVNFAFVLSHRKREDQLLCVDVSSYKSGKFLEASGERIFVIY